MSPDKNKIKTLAGVWTSGNVRIFIEKGKRQQSIDLLSIFLSEIKTGPYEEKRR